MLPPEAEPFVEKALHDLENSGSSLAEKHDLDTGLFQAQQGTEKFLKAGLLYEGYKGNVESFKHHLNKAYTELARMAPRYSALPKPTAALSALVPNMQLRYKASGASVNDAVSGYHSALHVCAMLARIWDLDQRRGSEQSDFRETRFYEAPTGNYVYCKSVNGAKVELLCFRPVGDRNVLYEMFLDQRESALYLEVNDLGLDQRLRGELTWYLRNCRRKVPPCESNIRIVRGREGNYATSTMRFRMSRSLE